jgi:hypothetical protein
MSSATNENPPAIIRSLPTTGDMILAASSSATVTATTAASVGVFDDRKHSAGRQSERDGHDRDDGRRGRQHVRVPGLECPEPQHQ